MNPPCLGDGVFLLLGLLGLLEGWLRRYALTKAGPRVLRFDFLSTRSLQQRPTKTLRVSGRGAKRIDRSFQEAFYVVHGVTGMSQRVHAQASIDKDRGASRYADPNHAGVAFSRPPFRRFKSSYLRFRQSMKLDEATVERNRRYSRRKRLLSSRVSTTWIPYSLLLYSCTMVALQGLDCSCDGSR